MTWLVHITARFIRVIQRIYGRKFSFLSFVLVIFLSSEVFLARADLLPQTPPQAPVSVNTAPKVALDVLPQAVRSASLKESKKTTVASRHEIPVRVRIPAIDLSVTVSNPNTTNNSVLDKALLSGAVRYPLSAKLGESGNVIIFGHSSYLPIVYNQAYKTFNGVQKLHKGNIVFVYSATTVYEYSVDSMKKENTTTGAINLSVSGKKLTLATCNVFGKKSDRFVVTAHLVKSYLSKS